ncbi:e3 ubiquitin-protein ligase huwe1 [Malassezia pachydermatis]|uniref:E3 ubiquitin-protein ligase huwe1 n=1 Tax=Malassezia pachydermatis TaxID=77020 RepID=A0A0M8MTR2_9BASI|nr:e3 ubiquitin-protein ligase huwe1 [Malassezia pachydermatis]KOS13421.1 e3 ubiquitin-protein ligase huwe1 [Malassezia pachydermatis]
MKITKTPKRKPEASADVLALVARIADAPGTSLAPLLAEIESWEWPRGDLYTWVPALNRLDTELERICTPDRLEPVQKTPFVSEDRALLLSILRFTRILLENCMNRKLYASYEHLNRLLGTFDQEVLEALLYLLLRPAQQHSGSGRHDWAISTSRLAVLATAWPPREIGLDMSDLAAEQAVMPSSLHSVHILSYRAPSAAPPGSPTTTPSTPAKAPTSGEAPGLLRVQVSHLDTDPRTPGEIVHATPDAMTLSEEERFELFHKIRVAMACRDTTSRCQTLVCRLLAIACFAHTAPESMANARLFLVEPSLVPRTAALVVPTEPANDWVASAALYALDSFGHFRVRLSEVLTAVNASVSHGLLLQRLRSMTESLAAMADAPTPPLSTHADAFIDALITLVANLTTTVSGSSMVVGAGLIPQLVEIACLSSEQNALVHRTCARAIGLLDNAMYAYPPAFQQFTAVHGVDALILRISVQVKQDCEATGPVRYGRLHVLRQLFRLFYHLMTTAGTAEGLRTVIDSPMLPALRTIFEHPHVFGSPVLAQAVTIMATLVHNEPTQLTTVQEQGLPEAFLSALEADMEPNVELLTAITTALGALCLNETGLRLVQAKPIVPSLLRVLDDARFHRILLDRDNANVLGASMDELLRHHPTFQDSVLDALVRVVDRIVEAGRTFQPPAEPADARSLYVLPPREPSLTLAPKRIATSLVTLREQDHSVPPAVPGDVNEPLQSFDVLCRFLEGLFRNAALCRDFMRRGGLMRLLAFQSTPCIAYTFPATQTADSTVVLLRTMVEESPSSVMHALLQQLQHSMLEWEADWLALLDHGTPASFRMLVRLHTRVHLLSDLCQAFHQTFTLAQAGSKIPMALLSALQEGGDLTTLTQLGELLRCVAWESMQLHAALGSQATHPSVYPVVYMADRLAAALVGLLGVVARLCVPRRTMDTEYWHVATNTAHTLAQMMQAWSTLRPAVADSDAWAEHTYLSLVSAHLLYDKRSLSSSQVHTLLLQACMEQGALDTMSSHVRAMVPLFTQPPSDDATEVGMSAKAHAINAIRAYFDLLVRLVQARPLLDAPQPSHSPADGVQPYVLLVDVRRTALRMCSWMWMEAWLPTLPLTTIRLLVQVLGLILQADRETPPLPRSEPAVSDLPSALAATLAGVSLPNQGSGPRALPSSTPPVDETRLSQLVEMGFPRGAARRALQRCHNNISAATEYIFTHPELEDEPDEPTAPSEPQGETQETPAAEAPVEAEAQPPAPERTTPRALAESPHKADLDAERTAFRPQFFPRLLELADTHEPLVFDAKHVFGYVVQDKERLPVLWASVVDRVPMQANDAHTPMRLHLLALLLTFDRISLSLPWSTMPALGERLCAWIEAYTATSPLSASPTWLASAWIALSGMLGLAEVPDETPTPSILPDDRLAFLHMARTRLLSPARVILQSASQHSPSIVLAVCRALVLLTRDDATAQAWARDNGVRTLLQVLCTRRFAALTAYQRLVVMILRHISEAGGALLPAMAKRVHAWMQPSSGRTRSADVANLLKSLSYTVLRQPTVFIEAASCQLELVEYDKERTQVPVRLLQNATLPTEPQEAERMRVDVIQALWHELYGALSGEAQPSEAPSGTNDVVMSEADARDAYAYFLLQCSMELVSSYMGSKVGLLQCTLPTGVPVLTYLLQEIVPVGFLQAYDAEELRKRMAESNWAMSLLVALAADPEPSTDAMRVPEALIGVRKALLDALHKALRDALLSSEAVEIRYGRMYALSDLCHRLLTAQPQAGSNAMKRAPVVLHIAKTMLEKNFVPLLTQVLADLDVHTPSVRSLVDVVLRPLEQLTKMSAKVAKADRRSARAREPSVNADTPSSPSVMSSDGLVDDSYEEGDEDDMPAPDFYRNSSLGMHTGEMEQGAYDEDDLSDDMDDEDEMEMEEYVSEEESELSTDAEGLDGDSTHVVEVMEEDDSGAESDSVDVDDIDEDDHDMDDLHEDDLYDSELPWDEESGDALSLDEHDYDYVVDDEGDIEVDANNGGGVDEILEALDDMEGGQDDEMDDHDGIDDEGDSGDELGPGPIRPLDMSEDLRWPSRSHDDRFGANWSWTQLPRSSRRTGPANGPPTFFALPSSETPAPARASHTSSRPTTHDQDAGFHPLLVDDQPSSSDGDGPTWARSVEALMGGGTMQFLEMFLQRNMPNGADASIRIELDHGHGTPRMQIANIGGDINMVPASSDPSAADPPAPNAPEAEAPASVDVVAESQRFTPLSTEARRGEEAHVLLGNAAAELGSALRTQLVHRLLPAYEKRMRDTSTSVAQRSASDSKRKLEAMEDYESNTPPRTLRESVTSRLFGPSVELPESDIDPTFLEALPEELREEAILSQQLGARLARGSQGLARDFLEVLPRSLRAELQRVDEPTAGSATTQPESQSSSANPSQDRENAQETHAQPREAIQLLDRAGLASLVRLLYFPSLSSRSSLLHKVLAHLCENARTRADLMQLLLMVLVESTHSTSAVDRSFAAVSSKASRHTPQRGTPRRPPTTPTPSASGLLPTLPTPLTPMGEEAPHLLASRSLETLSHLAHAHSQTALYCLREDKQKKGAKRVPVYVLLSLLEKDAILSHAPLVQALVALLHSVTKPLTYIRKDADGASSSTVVLGEPYEGVEIAAIPAERMAAIVKPLHTPMSSKAFQHTLGVASHLSHMPGGREAISEALQNAATKASHSLVNSLDALIQSLPPPPPEQETDDDQGQELSIRPPPPPPPTLHTSSEPLAKLASPTSAQAEFLRCLRALDYLYIRK